MSVMPIRFIHLAVLAVAIGAICPVALADNCSSKGDASNCPCNPGHDSASCPTGGDQGQGQLQGQGQGQAQGQGQGQGQGQIATGGTGVGIGEGGAATGGSVRDSGNSSSGSISGSRSGVDDSGNSSNRNRTSSSATGGALQTGDIGSTSSASNGGNTTSSGASADNSGGNSATTVDTGSHAVNSDNTSYNFVPPVVPSTPPTTLGVGQLSTVVGTCGPLQQVVQVPIRGSYIGLMSTSHVDLGFNDALAPVALAGVNTDYRRVTDQDGTVHLMGSQPIYYATVVGVSGARNLALGGGSGSGNWGQAGGGSSSAMQELVTRIVLRDCEAGTLRPAVVYKEAPAVKPER